MSPTRLVEIPQEYLPEIENLPGDLRQIASAIEEVWPEHGVKVAILLNQLFPGIPLYICNVRHLARKIRNDAIQNDYDNGIKVKNLAIKYNLSTRQIENILSEPPSQKSLKDRQ